MANKVEIVVVARNDTKGFASITEEIKKAVNDGGKDSDRLGETIGAGFKKGFDGAKKEAEKVGFNILESVKKTTGDMTAFGGKIGSDLAGAVGDAVPRGLASAAKSPQLMAAAGAVIAVVSPLLGAAIGGAVIGAGAGVGIVGGIMAVSGDARVKAAATDLGTTISENMSIDAQGIVQPVLNGLSIIRTGFQNTRAEFQSIFADVSGFIEPLAAGINNVIHILAMGFADMLNGAGPVLQEIIAGVEFMAGIVAQFFSAMGQNGEAAAHALGIVFGMLGGVLMFVLNTIENLTRVFGFFYELLGGSNEMFEGTRAGAESAAGGLNSFMEKMRGAGEESVNAKNSLQQFNDALRATYDPAFAFIQAEQGMKTAQDNFNEALRKHGKDSDESRAATLNLGKAVVTLQGAAGNIPGVFNGQVSPALLGAMHAGNLTQAQMEAVAASLRHADAAADAYDGTHMTTIITHFVTSGTRPKEAKDFGVGGFAHGGIAGAAGGGMRSNLKMVGEFGPELVKLPPSTQVHSNSDTRRMMSEGNGRGGEGVQITIGSDGTRLGDMMVELLRDTIRVRGGVVQTVLGKAGVA